MDEAGVSDKFIRLIGLGLGSGHEATEATISSQELPQSLQLPATGSPKLWFPNIHDGRELCCESISQRLERMFYLDFCAKAYMMADLYRKGGTCLDLTQLKLKFNPSLAAPGLDYPKGGSEAIVQASKGKVIIHLIRVHALYLELNLCDFTGCLQALVSGIETKSPSGRVWTKANP